MSQIATVSWWSHKDEAVQVKNVAELDHIIDDVIRSECNLYPTVVEIERLGSELTMAVGLPESFVQISLDPDRSAYLIAVATKDADRNDTFNFYFQGLHHTEILRQYVLPISKARELARMFFLTGTIPDGVEWEEI